MKAKELRTLSTEEFSARLVEHRKELMKLNSQVATGTTPKSPGQIRSLKRSIARMITINKQKEVTAGKA